MRHVLSALAALCLSVPALAQQGFSESHSGAAASGLGLSMVPATATSLLTAPKFVPLVKQILANNLSTNPVTFEVFDGTTNCNGGGCPLTPGPITIPAGGTYYGSFQGVPAVNGISWVAGTANALDGFVQWIY